jgi:hypothetical protein
MGLDLSEVRKVYKALIILGVKLDTAERIENYIPVLQAIMGKDKDEI